MFFMLFRLTKKPAQNGQDCLTRAEEVKAMLVKEKARTIAPRPRWHSPRYSSSRAPPGPRPDMPLRLSDQPRDPEAEATLLESDGEGMLGCCVRVWRRLGEVSRLLWVLKTKFRCVGRSTGEQKRQRHKCWLQNSTLSQLCTKLSTGRYHRFCAIPHGARFSPVIESNNFVSRKLRIEQPLRTHSYSPHLTFQS